MVVLESVESSAIRDEIKFDSVSFHFIPNLEIVNGCP
eukprot:UN18067